MPLKAFKNIILKYVYTGKANLGQFTTPQMNLILDTLGLANLFSYTELKDEIATFLKSSLNVSSGTFRMSFELKFNFRSIMSAAFLTLLCSTT